ncbi:glycosyltransferase family 2 protein [Flammeovirga pacifica]|uniref:Glycosyltransferase n=1 Tax=Flammeovirga pacifica TaxID=915059 RepID=A0A1S1YVW7_FLAPC|nr:glycosyltransferase family 2 protein [Flammeovirga pacifica]OHX64945.1 glycosyltransferase [Flammeovirga pacifica]
MKLSIVIPCYKTAPFLKEIARRTQETLTDDFEIIFVNDQGPLNDWEIIQELCMKHSFIKGINFSRNFGQHNAIYAGLKEAQGEWVVVMDGDLQDQPEEIPVLMKKAREGYDIVFAKRQNRQDGFFKKLSSKYFYKTLAYLTGTEQNAEIANFGLYHKKVIQAIMEMKDAVRYFPTMVRWVGFKQSSIYVEHASRKEGSSGYTLATLIKLASNVILSFSDKPLRLTVRLGLSISALSVIAVIFYLIQALLGNIKVMGYASLIISIWLLSGITITVLGMVGLYIGKIFDQVKDRPIVIVDEKINCN